MLSVFKVTDTKLRKLVDNPLKDQLDIYFRPQLTLECQNAMYKANEAGDLLKVAAIQFINTILDKDGMRVTKDMDMREFMQTADVDLMAEILKAIEDQKEKEGCNTDALTDAEIKKP